MERKPLFFTAPDQAHSVEVTREIWVNIRKTTRSSSKEVPGVFAEINETAGI